MGGVWISASSMFARQHEVTYGTVRAADIAEVQGKCGGRCN